MTAFNRAQFIGAAIESVLSSAFEKFELIVVDDSSSDDTWNIANAYQVRDPRVRVYRNPGNLGDYPNRNKAASYGRARYLKFVDSDDIIYPHGLGVMVDCMEAFPEAGLGLSSLPDPLRPCPILLSPNEAYREHYFSRDLLARAPGSAIIRRDVFAAVGGFSGKRQVGDHELWLKIASRYGVVKMPTDLLWDRAHSAQEKHYDDVGEKSAMHDEVRLAALDAADCPLSVDECAQARRRVEESQAQAYLAILRNGGGLKAANRYRDRVGISLQMIGAATLRKIVPPSGS